MTDRITNYTLSCPCQGLIIEGDLVKVHGEHSGPPEVGAYVGCSCGCLHRVREIDEAVHLIVVTALDRDEQIAAYADMGFDMVKVGCPHCDDVHMVEVPPGIEPTGLILECFDCREAFVVVGRDERELRTRALTHDEITHMREQAERAARARAFGGWSSGAGGARGVTPFGADPFGPFGRS